MCELFKAQTLKTLKKTNGGKTYMQCEIILMLDCTCIFILINFYVIEWISLEFGISPIILSISKLQECSSRDRILML